MSPETTENRNVGESKPVRHGWESERDTERAKVNVRWFATLALYGVMLYLRRHDPVIRANVTARFMWEILGAAVIMTALEAA